MAHSATRITPAPRPPALAALHAAPGSLVEPTDTMNRAVRSLTPPPRSPARQSATWRLCTADDRYRWVNRSVYVGEGRLRPGGDNRLGMQHNVYRLTGRYPDTRVPGRWVPRRARCVRPSTVCVWSSGLRPNDGRQLAGLVTNTRCKSPDQDPFLGELSRAQPYGSRIRHEDEK